MLDTAIVQQNYCPGVSLLWIIDSEDNPNAHRNTHQDEQSWWAIREIKALKV